MNTSVSAKMRARHPLRALLIGALAGTLLFTGCAPEPELPLVTDTPTASVSAPSASASASTPAPSDTATPVPTTDPAPTTPAAVAPVSLELRLDDIVLTNSDGSEQIIPVNSDAGATRQALFDLFGEVAPERPDERYPINLYRWTGVVMSWVGSGPSSASVSFFAGSEGDVVLEAAGIAVGATIAQLEAAGIEPWPAGAWDTTTIYRTDVEPVPGTTSLVRAGEKGERFLSFFVRDGVVFNIGVGDDFSDL